MSASSYVKFETVAKSTLVVSMYLFIVDPIPGVTRIVAIISCCVVLGLNRWYQSSAVIATNKQQAENNVELQIPTDDGNEEGDDHQPEENKEQDESRKKEQ